MFKATYFKNINFRFIILGIPNVLNILLPILIIPIVVNLSGIEEFGRVIFFQGILGLSLIFSENALNTITLADLNNENKSVLVSHTILSKLFLSSLILIFSLVFIPKEDVLLFLALNLFAIGQALNISFLYIYLKKEIIYSIIQLCIKVTAFLIFYISFKGNILYYALFIGLTELIIGFSTIIFSGKFREIISQKLKFRMIKDLWKRGFQITKITLLSAGYTNMVSIIIKFFYSYEVVGVYGAIEKIYRGLSNISAPFSLLLLGEGKFKTVSDLLKLKEVKQFLVLFFIVIINLFFLGEILLTYMLPNLTFKEYSLAYKISLLIPFIVLFSRIYMVNFFIKNNLEKHLFPLYLSLFVIAMPTLFLLIYVLGGVIGAVIGVFIIELICLFKLINSWKNHRQD